MDVSKYQEFVGSKFKKHEALTPKEACLLDWALGIGGEAGEVLELIKHHVFSKEPLDKMKLAKELGDILWYITAMAESSNMSLMDIFHLNYAKLSHRYEGAYTHADSAIRHEKENNFKDTAIYNMLKECIEDGNRG